MSKNGVFYDYVRGHHREELESLVLEKWRAWATVVKGAGPPLPEALSAHVLGEGREHQSHFEAY